MLHRTLLPCTCALLLLWGCAPEIGAACETALDCSSQASRACDRTQPDGYCTIAGCERGTCPEEAVCVKFHPSQGSSDGEEEAAQQERLSSTFCMAKCDSDGDCRDGEGYRCTSASQFTDKMEAESLDDPDQRFCSIPRVMR
jgi:hypothetical protein